MARLIDADNLVKILDEELEDRLKGGTDLSTALKANILVGFAKQVISDAPTVDPTKRGHWTSSQALAEAGEAQCSNCRTIYYAEDLYNVGETDENGIGQTLMPNCCPHCGAKMDKEAT